MAAQKSTRGNRDRVLLKVPTYSGYSIVNVPFGAELFSDFKRGGGGGDMLFIEIYYSYLVSYARVNISFYNSKTTMSFFFNVSDNKIKKI